MVIDMSKKEKKDEDIDVWKDRIENQDKSYINLPMNKEEYENFWNELVNAEVVELHNFEKREIFEGCLPIEIMAKKRNRYITFWTIKTSWIYRLENRKKTICSCTTKTR